MTDATDCDDLRAAVSPAGREVCDGHDNDCDGDVDDDDSSLDASTTSTWYDDDDMDGFGDPVDDADACLPPPGHVGAAGDCDDTRAEVNPAAQDVAGDGVDQDCDGADGPADGGDGGDGGPADGSGEDDGGDTGMHDGDPSPPKTACDAAAGASLPGLGILALIPAALRRRGWAGGAASEARSDAQSGAT